MAADWDTSGYDADADTVKISETSTATAAYDAYEADPDTENYANGNDPETAYQNQGRPDNPNGLGSYAGDSSQENWDSQGRYTDTTDQNTETDESGDDGEAPDMWGDTDPDAANYADLDEVRTVDEQEDNVGQDQPTAGAGIDADTGQSANDDQADEHAERNSSPEQQRITALEAENADARQQLADARQEIAELKANNNEQAARLDRIEQFLARSKEDLDDANVQERGDKSVTSADQQKAQDAAFAEHTNSGEQRDTKDSRSHGWRRVTSSETLGLIGALGGAAQTAGEFAVHATPDGMIGLGLTAVGVAQVLRARAEKKAERKGRA